MVIDQWYVHSMFEQRGTLCCVPGPRSYTCYTYAKYICIQHRWYKYSTYIEESIQRLYIGQNMAYPPTVHDLIHNFSTTTNTLNATTHMSTKPCRSHELCLR